jgi:predicted transposase YdaD
MPKEEAVDKAVDTCIKDGILADFLTKYRAEARSMSIFEYDEEKEMELIRQAEFEKGEAYGKAEGRAEGASKKETNIIMHMYENNFTLDQIALATAKTPEEVEEIIKKSELVLA